MTYKMKKILKIAALSLSSLVGGFLLWMVFIAMSAPIDRILF